MFSGSRWNIISLMLVIIGCAMLIVKAINKNNKKEKDY